MSIQHWNEVYSVKPFDERSWTQSLPSDSLELFEKSHFSKNEPIIDIGGGASFLIDELIHNGFTDVTLLDISPIAVSESQARLGAKVQYINAEITQWTPERTYAVWHDRAVFHFLTSAEQQQNYLNAFLSGTTSGSHLIIATFAPTGPDSCSGLPVRRWSQEQLMEFFSHDCDIVRTFEAVHITPWGSAQPFTWLHAQRR